MTPINSTQRNAISIPPLYTATNSSNNVSGFSYLVHQLVQQRAQDALATQNLASEPSASYNSVSQSNKFELSLTSFLPAGQWSACDEKRKFFNSDRAMWTRDSLSGAIYLNQPTDHLRFKLSFLTGFFAGIVGGNAISLTINAAYRALKVASLSHFWLPISCIDKNQADGSYHFKNRCIEFAKDIARIVATPFAWLGLLFASWGGAISPMENGPRDGAKIFSSIEIAMYGGTIKEGHFGWAPCYQPNATTHGLGGDINQERAC